MFKNIFNLYFILLLLHNVHAQVTSASENEYVRFIKNYAADLSDEDVIDFALRADFNNNNHDKDEENENEDENNLVDALIDENDEEAHEDWYHCDKDLRQPHGFRKFIDITFLRKFVRNLNPFAKTRKQMFFYLFQRDFHNCGREMDFENMNDVRRTGFNASLPTRIIIHGWMSQARGTFNRDVKNAYLKRGNFNVIIADWSANAANINYFSVVKLIEGFGAQLAGFTQNLHKHFGVRFDDIYLIGHSLGAQIAGAAGKRIKPAQFNTIFALDPAGPKFRRQSTEFRIDPSDAKYVESIQTSANLGFIKPTGTATFYPNYGFYQKKCFYIGCSHVRAYKMFAESITSQLGFWGTPCRRRNNVWECDETRREMYQMGGEPSVPKKGSFYVDTATGEPFALGRS